MRPSLVEIGGERRKHSAAFIIYFYEFRLRLYGRSSRRGDGSVWARITQNSLWLEAVGPRVFTMWLLRPVQEPFKGSPEGARRDLYKIARGIPLEFYLKF